MADKARAGNTSPVMGCINRDKATNTGNGWSLTNKSFWFFRDLGQNAGLVQLRYRHPHTNIRHRVFQRKTPHNCDCETVTNQNAHGAGFKTASNEDRHSLLKLHLCEGAQCWVSRIHPSCFGGTQCRLFRHFSLSLSSSPFLGLAFSIGRRDWHNENHECDMTSIHIIHCLNTFSWKLEDGRFSERLLENLENGLIRIGLFEATPKRKTLLNGTAFLWLRIA